MIDLSDVRQPGLPLWRHIATVIGDEIESGRFEPGDAIPSEHELMARFDVSRHTARRAVLRLREQGIVEVTHGRGAFVRKEPLEYTLTERPRFSQNLEQQGFSASNVFLSANKVPATPELAQVLKLETKDPVWHLIAISYADEVPISLGRIFHPAKRFPNIANRRKGNPDLAAVYAEYGITDFTRLSTWISARIPSEVEAGLLKIEPLDPVLVSQKIDVDSVGVPIEYNETMFSGRQITMHFPASERAIQSGSITRPPQISGGILEGP